ncbi:hypothetical protein FHS43_000345 [Streptosporangium becharense]|uniref:Uncharacterized protein n=1 Tax=Streptosporangium becharense TaxID=1816182 RepID=A0A7W9MGA1_9ACTN|nr:hypothetical protein [Streptosporangium becharense]MBB2909099.1 hypothetical protein [Streptosporangium becharense]MBB5819882.1 hypothetical protein [Streptosporangium becharense]
MTLFRTMTGSPAPGTLGLRVGETVEVLGEAEIMATLDGNGELEGLPFMPEMLAFCGRRLTVHKVAHKLCDTINRTGMRRMERAVHLIGARCDGQAHGGCQTACQFYWKEAWLRRVDPANSAAPAVPADLADPPGSRSTGAFPSGEPRPDSSSGESQSGESQSGASQSGAAHPGASQPGAAPPDGTAADTPGDLAAGRALLPVLVAATRKPPGPDGEERFSCQATELLRAAPACLPFKDVGQYVRDVRTGNAGPLFTLRAILVGLFNRFQDRSARVLPRPLRIRGGLRWGFVRGRLTGATPAATLDLRPGEWVRVKSKEEIVKTLNQDLLNRGMGFEEEMSRHCGRVARVLARVERCIDERTGRLLEMRTPSVTLEGVVCTGAYSAGCPRQFVPFWREIWLERVGDPAAGPGTTSWSDPAARPGSAAGPDDTVRPGDRRD